MKGICERKTLVYIVYQELCPSYVLHKAWAGAGRTVELHAVENKFLKKPKLKDC
jgi:hypothetical protein